MAIPSSVLGPTVGAFISGLIGVIIVEYRNHRDEVAELERWYDQVIRLADQIERETPDSYLADIHGRDDANETTERADDLVAAYGRIGERLRDHVNRAPPEVLGTVIDPATETARYCRMVEREGRDQKFLDRVEAVVKSGKKLRRETKEAKKTVGWL